MSGITAVEMKLFESPPGERLVEGTFRQDARKVRFRATRFGRRIFLATDFHVGRLVWKGGVWHHGREHLLARNLPALSEETRAFWAPLLGEVEKKLLGWNPRLAGLGGLPWEKHLPARPPLEDVLLASPKVRRPADIRAVARGLCETAVPRAPSAAKLAISERAARLRAAGSEAWFDTAVLQVAAEAADRVGASSQHVLETWGWNPSAPVPGRERR